MLLIECCFFFFNDTATTEIYTLSLHDALPISWARRRAISSRSANSRYRPEGGFDDDPNPAGGMPPRPIDAWPGHAADRDRKSTRLNSSHANISYAVFCLKKKI